MPLTNNQYERIMREYEEKQNRNRRVLMDRQSLIRKKLPRYEEIENSISSLCVGRVSQMLGASPENNGTPDIALLSDEAFKDQILSLKYERIALLKAAGYSEDYLEPQYECPLCRDTGYQGTQKCICLKNRITTLLYNQSNLGPALEWENFDNLSYDYHKGDDLAPYKKAVISAQKFVEEFPAGRNLLIYGNVGSGKTFLSKCITKALIDKGYPVLYFSAGTLIDILLGKTEMTDSGITREEIYNCDLLIVDDLGTEYPNDFVVSKFFNCLDSRLQDKKSTIVSTNLSLKDLRDIYSERIFSRIASSYELIRINCSDIRFQKTGRL